MTAPYLPLWLSDSDTCRRKPESVPVAGTVAIAQATALDNSIDMKWIVKLNRLHNDSRRKEKLSWKGFPNGGHKLLSDFAERAEKSLPVPVASCLAIKMALKKSTARSIKLYENGSVLDFLSVISCVSPRPLQDQRLVCWHHKYCVNIYIEWANGPGTYPLGYESPDKGSAALSN